MKRDLEFLYEIGSLRFVPRTWRHFLNADFANVAEHTLRVTWIALLIANHEKGADQERVMKLALVHDVSESRAGDADYLSKQYMVRKEREAISDIVRGTSFEGEMADMWLEAEAKSTLEANILKDADNLDVAMEIREQAARGMAVGTIWNADREKGVYTKLNTETARRLWKEILESNPHDWHLNAKNRFTEGDWKK